MRAYVFWHRPFADVDVRDYETALQVFQADLMNGPPAGLRACATYRISAVPWLGDRDGYEDWYLVNSSADLDQLNQAAVTPERVAIHSAVASKMEFGRGGLYYHLHGSDQTLSGARILWLKRPRGIRYEQLLEHMIGGAHGFVSCWRLQMVLGPADEFAVIGTRELELTVPEGWRSRTIERASLAPIPGQTPRQ